MNSERLAEITANLERAEKSLRAAKELLDDGHQDFAASRAYYVAFYSASALLLSAGYESGKHSGVIAQIHQHFVKTEKLDKEQGKNLNWLFELRSVGDYGVVMHVTQEEAIQAIRVADGFLQAIKTLLKK